MSKTVFSEVIEFQGFDYLARTMVFDEGEPPPETRIFVEGIGRRADTLDLDLSVDDAGRLIAVLGRAIAEAPK